MADPKAMKPADKIVFAWFLKRRNDKNISSGNRLTNAYIHGFHAKVAPRNALVRSNFLPSVAKKDDER